MSIASIRKRVYEVLEPARDGDIGSLAFDVFITIVIFLNVMVMILLTVKEIREYYVHFAILLFLLAAVTLFIFVIEYILRIWSCTADPKYRNPVFGRLKWALTPYALIDLIVILPYFLFVLFGIDLTGIVVLRVFRLFKIMRYSDSISLIVRVVKMEKNTLITTYLVLFIVLVASATLMYQVEYPAQPEAFGNIPDAMWWGVITLTTTGYGDVVPITPTGKLLGGIISLIGIGIFALPAGILASGFTKALEKNMESRRKYKCPHCGNEIPHEELWVKTK